MDFFLSQPKGYTLVTKKGCKWSKKAKAWLKNKNIKFIEIQVHQNDMSKDTWGYKKIKTCFKSETFPIIYDDNGKKIGGYKDLMSR